MKFSKTELKELAKAWIAISVAFGILIRPGSVSEPSFLISILLAALTVGLGFFLHELAHKYFAQKYKCFAEFRAHDGMLVLAILMSFFGFIFAAPGAVIISGYVDKKRNGIISVAGPITNLVLAIIFALLLPILGSIAYYGFLINAWLGLFNMIPLGNFDGTKVLAWNKGVYAITLIIALFLVFFSSLLGISL
ncbi:hypothetical protein CMO92_04280 [Candidatus Woesearchaeota archaeon]|nr:hypothetical protein [Candidatus Woesearchaeota archaeon]